MKNNYKITDFPEGLKILFTDGEEWIVVKKGMRGSGSWRKSDEITIKPFNKLAKDKNVSLPIDVTLEFLNSNIKEINESEVNESNRIDVVVNKYLAINAEIESAIDNDSNYKYLRTGLTKLLHDCIPTKLLRNKSMTYEAMIRMLSSSEVNKLNADLDSFISEQGLRVNESNRIEVGTFVRYKKDKDFTGGKVKSIKGGNAEIHNWDGSTTELPLKDLEYVKSWNESEVNEGRSQIKRKYGEYGAIRVNSEAPVRNSILEFVGKRFVTRTELDSHLTQLTEDRGKAIDQNAWFKRNERYFESFTNRGQEVWTLSKYGKRVLENIIKSKQEKTMIKESIGLFKFTTVNEAIDVKYWTDYNDEAERTFAAEEFAEKSKDFDGTFEEAVDDWNNENDFENRIKGAQIKKIEKLAKEFFKKTGWISINIVQAMIMQES
jgi:hypothetical protein